MKKRILVLMTIIGFIFVTGLPSYPAQNDPAVDIYVNGAIGKDHPNWGDRPEKPFKTISYAVSRVPFKRDSSDFFANIYVAAGVYNESVRIDIDRVGLFGAGKENTEIAGSENTSVTLDILHSDNFIVDGFKISNGGFAGIDLMMTSGTISNTMVQGNGFGLLVTDSLLSLDEFISTENYLGGITAGHYAKVMLNGNISVINNYGGGMGFFNKSTLNLTDPFGETNVIVSGNRGIGCALNEDSSVLVLYRSELLVENNNGGINLVNSDYATGGGDLFGWGRVILRDNNVYDLAAQGGFLTFGQSAEGNIISSMDLGFGSKASFFGENDSIENISCHETALTQGYYSCPE